MKDVEADGAVGINWLEIARVCRSRGGASGGEVGGARIGL